MQDLNPEWEYVADTVMGGVSTGRISQATSRGRSGTRLTGEVSTDNNGGFIQMAFDLSPDGLAFDATEWAGVEIEVRGNGHKYELRLRTTDMDEPWQSFRHPFTAAPKWTTLRLPFTAFEAHRTEVAFNAAHLRRMGVLAIGREFQADVSVAAVRLYA